MEPKMDPLTSEPDLQLSPYFHIDIVAVTV